jgi:hypothetical protein
MARITVPRATLSINGGTVSAGTALGTADGHVIASAAKHARMVVHIDNTGTVVGTATIKAGDNPPAFRTGMGDLAIAIAASTASFFCIESARHLQSDGTIEIDVAAFLSGTIAAYELPGEL